ncbi:MAG: prepilin-type N-terminal cleavage/methylation domain-containing protein, partial [Planctomycetaceae bacterium]|nr:prepilin-type N-terminal cleavage/methylation domain-containing protein [Planctomycetaceae bacterium]
MYFVKENYCNENYLSARFLTVADKMKVNLCNCKRTRKSGFTLVELLVVIAIIGILATLITAAAFRVIATTRVTTVRMKINELEQALELYKNKFGEYPPML